jgi:F-type H+-transporting ATPase subunit a
MNFILGSEQFPEVPNFLTLLSHYFISNSKSAALLYAWENIFFSIAVALLLSALFYAASRQTKMIPTGLQNFMELIVETTQKALVGIMGPEGTKYVPFLGTLFLYILSMNLFGLIPLMKSPTSSLSVTTALAICVFCLVQYLNIKNMGLKGFFYHLLGSPKNLTGWMIAPLMFPIELLTQLSRPLTLALRLFGNMLGEKILVGFFSMVGAVWLFSLPLQTPALFFALLTGLMQALVFTLLSAVYIFLSVMHTEENNH